MCHSVTHNSVTHKSVTHNSATRTHHESPDSTLLSDKWRICISKKTDFGNLTIHSYNAIDCHKHGESPLVMTIMKLTNMMMDDSDQVINTVIIII